MKAGVEILTANTDFSEYGRSLDNKVTGISKEQHLHSIKLTEIVENINFRG